MSIYNIFMKPPVLCCVFVLCMLSVFVCVLRITVCLCALSLVHVCVCIANDCVFLCVCGIKLMMLLLV